MPDLTISQPQGDAHVVVAQPFVVSGRASDVGMPEPHMVDRVSVQVDEGPVVNARLTHVPDKKRIVVDYIAEVEVTAGADPHTVTVTAVNDNGQTAVRTVAVFAGQLFHAAPPAVLVELLSLVEIPLAGAGLVRLVRQIQNALVPAADLLAGFGLVLAGPNLTTGLDPSGLHLLRLGVWVQDKDFPVLPATPPSFPLPRLNAPGAAAGFALAERLPVPLSLGVSYAFSVPTSSLQSLVDAVFPQVKDAVDGTFATLDAIRVETRPPGTVATTVEAHTLLGIPASATLTEQIAAPLDNDSGQHLPAVVGHDSSSSTGNVLDWVLGVVLPPFGLALAAAAAVVSHVASDASGRVNGVAAAVVAGLPPRMPLHNTDLGVTDPAFPTMVPDWTTFGATPDGILATGTLSVLARDQSTVRMAIHGPGSLEGYQSEMGGGGAAYGYVIDLTDLAPDAEAFTWQVTGAGVDRGAIAADPFGLGGTAEVAFPLPVHVAPGRYDFDLTVTASETCATDPSQMLTASQNQPVRVLVKKDPANLP